MLKDLVESKTDSTERVKKYFDTLLKNGAEVLDVERELLEVCSQYPSKTLLYKKAFFYSIQKYDTRKALIYGEEILLLEEDVLFIKALAKLYKDLGKNKRYNQLIDMVSPLIRVESRLEDFVKEKRTFSSIEKYIKLKVIEFPNERLGIYKVMFSVLRDLYTEEVLPYIEEVIAEEELSDKFLRVIAIRYKRIGAFIRYKELVAQINPVQKSKQQLKIFLKEKAKFPIIEEYIKLKIKEYPEKEIEFSQVMFSILKDIYTKDVLKYADIVVEKGTPSDDFILVVAKRYERCNNIAKSQELMTFISPLILIEKELKLLIKHQRNFVTLLAYIEEQSNCYPEYKREIEKLLKDLLGKTKNARVDNLLKNKISLNRLEEMELKYNETQHIEFDLEGFTYNYLSHYKKNSKKLVVFFNGAVNTCTSELPAFQRWSWLEKLPYSSLIVMDPTLNNMQEGTQGDILIGWYQGDENHFILETIVKQVSKIAEKKGIDVSNILFYGSSAGGFAAMLCSAMLQGSKALVINPQTNILYYHKKAVDKILKVLNFDSSEKLLENDYRLNVLKYFEKVDYYPPIYYKQNVLDTLHYTKHYMPLEELYASLGKDNQLYEVLIEDKRMHNSIPAYEEAKIDIAKTFEYFDR